MQQVKLKKPFKEERNMPKEKDLLIFDPRTGLCSRRKSISFLEFQAILAIGGSIVFTEASNEE